MKLLFQSFSVNPRNPMPAYLMLFATSSPPCCVTSGALKYIGVTSPSTMAKSTTACEFRLSKVSLSAANEKTGLRPVAAVTVCMKSFMRNRTSSWAALRNLGMNPLSCWRSPM